MLMKAGRHLGHIAVETTAVVPLGSLPMVLITFSCVPCGLNNIKSHILTSSHQAFQQLHAKRAETSQNVMMIQIQIAQLKRSVKVSELTEEEVKGCPEDTRMYRSIGRM